LTGNQPVARPQTTHRTTQKQNKCTQTSMPGVGFEPTIPVLELAKTVHVLSRAGTVIGFHVVYNCILHSRCFIACVLRIAVSVRWVQSNKRRSLALH
jgi:hypothetical protein